ncbi:MAG: lysophospholipid acyltransferase family protein [Candidatus Loosdrechtia sp.]|uniref:lysophospholipid acyltransferase family protein n=1 Tax=Candidatus Loosdrechtia sp. TaxID=3101272 RepID=UPI00403AB81F
MTYIISLAIIRFYTRWMLRMDVTWKESLPTGPIVIVANHPSCSDPIFLASVFPHPMSILISDKPFLIPVMGTFLQWLGQIPVPAGKGRTAFESARQLLEAGHPVALFPEGRVSPRKGGFHPLRTGAARLALLTKVPVVPVGIYLERNRNYAIASIVEGKRTIRYWCLRGVYNITIGPAMNFEGNAEHRHDVETVLKSITEQIAQLSLESERRAKGIKQQHSIGGIKRAIQLNRLKKGVKLIMHGCRYTGILGNSK